MITKKDIRRQAIIKTLIFLAISWVIFILFYHFDLQYKMANLLSNVMGLGKGPGVGKYIDSSFFASCLYCVVYLAALVIPIYILFGVGSIIGAFVTFLLSWLLIVSVFQDWFSRESSPLRPYQTLFGVLFLILFHLGTYGINYLKARKRAKEALQEALELQAEREAEKAEKERRETAIAEKVAKIMMEKQEKEREQYKEMDE